MKRIVSLLIVFVFSLCGAFAVAGEYNKVVRIGDKAPNFNGIPAVFQGKGGAAQETVLNLADVKEEVVVLVFVAAHCPYVQANEQRLNEFAAHFTPQDGQAPKVKVIALSVSLQKEDTLPGIQAFMKKHKSTYLYGYDATQKVGRDYGATNTPQYFVLDKERKIRYMGALDDIPLPSAAKKPTKHYLQDAVSALLKGENPPIEETRHPGCGIEYGNR